MIEAHVEQFDGTDERSVEMDKPVEGRVGRIRLIGSKVRVDDGIRLPPNILLAQRMSRLTGLGWGGSGRRGGSLTLGDIEVHVSRIRLEFAIRPVVRTVAVLV